MAVAVCCVALVSWVALTRADTRRHGTAPLPARDGLYLHDLHARGANGPPCAIPPAPCRLDKSLVVRKPIRERKQGERQNGRSVNPMLRILAPASVFLLSADQKGSQPARSFILGDPQQLEREEDFS